MATMEVKFTVRCQDCGESLKVSVDDTTPYIDIAIEPCDCVEHRGFLRGQEEALAEISKSFVTMINSKRPAKPEGQE
jgi:hypothetical protein